MEGVDQPAGPLLVIRAGFPDTTDLIPNTPHGENRIVEFFKKLAGLIVTPLDATNAAHAPYYVIVDGLNALIDWVSLRFSGVNDRQIIDLIERMFQADRFLRGLNERGNAELTHVDDPRLPDLVLMTAEDRVDRESHWMESYAADTLIELRQEKIVPDPSLTNPPYEENLLRCHVPKGRNLQVQRRSSCYEFDSQGVGLKFFETYAAPGVVSLFQENACQQNEISDFKKLDLPGLFPCLSVRSFDRATMFQEYMHRRHLEDIPRRRTMALHNLDEYWVAGMIANTPPLLMPVPLKDLSLYLGARAPLLQYLQQKLDDVCRASRIPEDSQNFLPAVPHHVNFSFLIYRDGHHSGWPGEACDSWDKLEKLCLKAKEGSHEADKFYPFLIETKTIDSFVAFVLELMYTHGGGWSTTFPNADQEGPRNRLIISFRNGNTEQGVIDALCRLERFFRLGIVRRHGTIDPANSWNRAHSGDWIYARHWYSTLVETLTHPLNSAPEAVCPLRVHDVHVFGIPRVEPFHSTSCWGEWYLGVEAGTENSALARKVIEHLCSSRNVIKRAIVGGGMPPFQQFYDEYGEARCYGTDKTFNDMIGLVNNEHAISRARFAKYRFVMQRLHACAFTIMTTDFTGQSDSAIRTNITALWRHTVTQIQNATVWQ